MSRVAKDNSGTSTSFPPTAYYDPLPGMRLTDAIVRDAYINMKPMVMARELESEFQLLQDLRVKFKGQLSAAQLEEARLLRLKNALQAKNSSEAPGQPLTHPDQMQDDTDESDPESAELKKILRGATRLKNAKLPT